MARFAPDLEQLQSLQNKVVVLTGGANGIGAATIDVFHKHGALVVFGDLDSASGEKVASRYESKTVQFLRTDVTKYGDNLALFRLALKTYGKIDHAFSIAGVVEQGNVFDPGLTIEDVEKPPSTIVLDVNLLGPFCFTRIATVYLRQNSEPTDDKSIILMSSISGLSGSPGLPAYTTSKHGLQGLMRTLRYTLPATHNIRINAVCPLATDTSMLSRAVSTGWHENRLPMNTAEDVANMVLGLVAGTHKSNGKEEAEMCNGLSVYVEGGRGWEVEEGLGTMREVWLGKGPNERLMAAGRFLQSGAAWTSDQ